MYGEVPNTKVSLYHDAVTDQLTDGLNDLAHLYGMGSFLVWECRTLNPKNVYLPTKKKFFGSFKKNN